MKVKYTISNMTDWVHQTSGLIDHYLPKYQTGDQPVRVLHNITLYMFIHYNTDFHRMLVDAVIKKGLNPEVIINEGNEPLRREDGRYRTPSIDEEKRLEVHETFQSYVWIMTYVIFTLYIETINHPRINEQAGRKIKRIHQSKIEEAHQLFSYGKSLIVDFTAWDKDNLPNPEKYLAEERDYIEQSSMYYSEAIKFILCHEFIHVNEMHIDEFAEKGIDDEDLIKMELEADELAIDLIKKGMVPGREFISEGGIIIAILSMFYFTNSTKGKRHPNLEERLFNALKKLGVRDDHFGWSLACVGLDLWDQQFNLGINWDKSLTDKELFISVVEQIKSD